MFGPRPSVYIGNIPPKESILDTALAYDEDHGYSAHATDVAHNMMKCSEAFHRASSTLGGHALQIQRLKVVLDSNQVYTLVREDETRRIQQQVQEDIEPQIQALLNMAEERQQERDRQEDKLRQRVMHEQKMAMPKGKKAVMRREELLRQQRDRLQKDIRRIEQLTHTEE